MRKLSFLRISMSMLCLFLVFTINAQEENVKDESTSKTKKEKKDKKSNNFSKKIWGNYDSNALSKSLSITLAYVSYQDNLLKDVIVNVLFNNEIFMSDTTDKDGGFTFDLKYDHRYVLAFNKNGYVTKKVEVDLTTLTDNAKNEGFNMGKFNMRMLKYVEGMNVEEYKIPVARYYYSDVNKLVVLDRNYLKKRKELLAIVNAQNAKVLAGVVEDENDLDADYNILIRDADIEFAAKDYNLANELYLEALKLKSLEQYPRDQLKKIKVFLAQELSTDEKYASLISQGDDAFNLKDYESAWLAYKSAIKIKTTEEHPRAQIKKIESLENANKNPVVGNTKKKYSLMDVQVNSENNGYSNELAKKYPQGLTEETYTEGSKTIVKRVIVEGEVGIEYKKITHNWGGVYYFKNGTPVNHFVWQKEAIQ